MVDLLERLREALVPRYRIERELGAGGMAVVFLAEDLRHHRRVALKVLRPDLGVEISSGRFLREIETVASLTHPHILPIHDSGETAGLLYYVMPYVEGETLRGRLHREKQLPVEDAIRIAHEVADALSYAHGRGVIHRDIKPENILLQSGHAVVADFGIARAVSAAGEATTATLTATGTVLGTPAYMSPEQASGDPEVDGRTDLYSLGCVLYEMLAGQPPFTGPTVESLRRQHLVAEPPSITALRPTVPGGVAAAIRRAMAKAPADRFSKASLFIEALSDPERAVVEPSLHDRPWSRALLGFFTLGLAVATVLLLHPWRKPPVRSVTAPAPPRSAVAVLPFQSLSTQQRDAYFAGGLHEELLTQLAKVASLKVTSRTSVMGYQETSRSLKAIAQELGVGSVVEGSVQVDGQRLRVNVQLIDAATDEHLWAERYDRTLADAFAVQSDIAQRVVTAVGAALTASEQGRLAAAPTKSTEAYLLYVQGREYQTRPGNRRQDVEAAQHLFERSLDLDPSFALAHAALANAHGTLYWFYDPTPERLAREREEAEAALRLAPGLAEARAAMGWARYRAHDYPGALTDFKAALRDLPNDAELVENKAYVERRLGHWNEAIAGLNKAAQLNPRSADIPYGLAGSYYWERRFEDAIRAYDRALELAPDFHDAAVGRGWTYFVWQDKPDTIRATLRRLPGDASTSLAHQRAELFLWEREADSLLLMPEIKRGDVFAQGEYMPAVMYAGWAHLLKGEPSAARPAFRSALALLDSRLAKLPDDSDAHFYRGLALAELGRRDEALREARWLQQSVVYRLDALKGQDMAWDRALILARVEDVTGAVAEIDRLLSGHWGLTVRRLRRDPLLDRIRDDPRFKILLAKYASGPAA